MNPYRQMCWLWCYRAVWNPVLEFSTCFQVSQKRLVGFLRKPCWLHKLELRDSRSCQKGMKPYLDPSPPSFLWNKTLKATGEGEANSASLSVLVKTHWYCWKGTEKAIYPWEVETDVPADHIPIYRAEAEVLRKPHLCEPYTQWLPDGKVW
jgi:hypothetical protein